jgi:membrane protease YdiL (CAAX protease family)
VYFALAAPIQEEVIFRGLIQTGIPLVFVRSEERLSRSSLIIAALLFAAVHLTIGPITAACAAALGILAGELRRRSSSLLPAVFAHALFNLPAVLGAAPR